MDLSVAIAEERVRIADMLEGFTDEQWAHPTCCEGWTAAEVAGHMLAGPIKGMVGSIPYMLKGLGRPDKINDLTARDLAKMGREALISEIRAQASNPFVPPGFPKESPLVDVTIHGQDIGRPLGIELDVPLDRWQPVLRSATHIRYALVSASRQLKGLSFASTDSDFAVGDGPLVTGTSRDLAHAMWGRAQAVDALDGPGIDTLRQRLS